LANFPLASKDPGICFLIKYIQYIEKREYITILQLHNKPGALFASKENFCRRSVFEFSTRIGPVAAE
jgi:hypothetical protein